MITCQEPLTLDLITVDMTWVPNPSLNIETSYWTQSNMISMPFTLLAHFVAPILKHNAKLTFSLSSSPFFFLIWTVRTALYVVCGVGLAEHYRCCRFSPSQTLKFSSSHNTKILFEHFFISVGQLSALMPDSYWAIKRNITVNPFSQLGRELVLY